MWIGRAPHWRQWGFTSWYTSWEMLCEWGETVNKTWKLNYAFLPARVGLCFMNMGWFYSCKYVCRISELFWMSKDVFGSIRFWRWEALIWNSIKHQTLFCIIFFVNHQKERTVYLWNWRDTLETVLQRFWITYWLFHNVLTVSPPPFFFFNSIYKTTVMYFRGSL